MKIRNLSQKTPRFYFIAIGVLYLYFVALLHWLVIRLSNPQFIPDLLAPQSNTPFFQPGPRFSDFFQILYASRYASPYKYQKATNYPQGALLIARLLGFFHGWVALALYVSICLGIISAVIWSIHSLPKLAKFALVLSYPIMYAVDRGNFDLICVALILLSVSISEYRPALAGCLIGIAIAAKIWPAIFMLALLRQPKFRTLLFSCATTVLTFVAAGVLVFGGSPLVFLSAASAPSAAVGLTGFAASTNLRTLVALAGSVVSGHGLSATQHFASQPLTLVIRGAVGLYLITMTIINERLSQRLLAAGLFILLIPSSTSTYMVGCLLAPLVVLFTDTTHRYEPNWWFTICWILVLGPTSFWYVPGGGNLNTESFLVPGALLVLSVSVYRPTHFARTSRKSRSEGNPHSKLINFWGPPT